MDVLKFTNINKVFTLDNYWKQFEETRYVTLFWGKREVFPFVSKLHSTFIDKFLKFVILESIHQQ
jgi:hypothetical protein